VEGKVDAAGGSSRGDDIAVLDEEPVGQDLGLREAPLELPQALPMGGAVAAVEESRLAERECARAGRDEPGASAATRTPCSLTAVSEAEQTDNSISRPSFLASSRVWSDPAKSMISKPG